MSSITIQQIQENFTADFGTGKLYRKNGKETGSICRVGKNGESYTRTSLGNAPFILGGTVCPSVPHGLSSS